MALLFVCPILLPAHADLDERTADVSRQNVARPSNAGLYLKRGELHRMHRDFGAALADFGRTRDLEPDLAAVRLARGRALHEAGRNEEPLSDLVLNRDLKPQHREGMLALARTLVALDRPLEAATQYGRAITISERSTPDYYLGRFRALVAAGHIERALAGLDQGVSDLGPLVTLQGEAIKIEIDCGEYDRALDRLATIEPWMLAERHHYRRGEILEAAGRPDLARAAFEVSLERFGE